MSLSIWTVYDNPRDKPLQYVARRFEVVPNSQEPEPTDDTISSSDLELIRRSLALRGLSRFVSTAGPNRPASIVEWWL